MGRRQRVHAQIRRHIMRHIRPETPNVTYGLVQHYDSGRVHQYTMGLGEQYHK